MDDSYNFSDVNEAISKFDCKQIYDEINKLPEAAKKVFNLFVIDSVKRNLSELECKKYMDLYWRVLNTIKFLSG